MSDFTIYLAGGKADEWRKKVTRRWGDAATTIDPFSDCRQGAAYEFTNDDLAAIDRSDLVFAVVDYHTYTGLATEVGYARAKGIPVILVWDESSPLTPARVDLFVASCAKAMFVHVGEAARFVEDRYLSGA